MANEFVIKNGFISQGNSLVNGTLTATTISATTYQNLPVDPNTYITGFTYSSNTFTIDDNSGSTFNATINSVTGFTINGNLNVTGTTNLTGGLTANTISATTYQNLPVDPNTYVTAFTYNNNTFTLNDNSGSTFNATINTVTGWTVNGDLTVTGNTSLSSVTATTISATTYQNLPVDPNTYLTAFTYSNNTFTLNDNSGNTFNATLNTVTGITINGDLSVTGATNLTGGLTANTVSASTITGTTFYGDGSNLTGIKFTGGTVSGATNFTGGLTANTISATTYQNLPLDIFVTGGTYDNTTGTASFTNNSGGTFNVSGFTTTPPVDYGLTYAIANNFQNLY